MNDATKKLEPYSMSLVIVGIRSRKIGRLRGELKAELDQRRGDLIAARSLGASREELADAANVSLVRVSQIIAGGGK